MAIRFSSVILFVYVNVHQKTITFTHNAQHHAAYPITPKTILSIMQIQPKL